MWADLHYPDENDVTNFERLSQLEQSTGQSHLPELNIPIDVSYLWEWFMDLNRSRPSGFGVSPISYLEIKAWSELSNISVTSWEVSTLKRMDEKFVESINRQVKARSNPNKTKAIGVT